ncbi:hypothetical protein LTR15_006037 [Elasticomyces elasticus]|nr:hypothetical protein LTR15_006037 [Elasticomyces elasticus]
MSNNIKISMLEKQDLKLPRIFYLALGVVQSHLGTCCNGYSGSYGNSAILLHAGYQALGIWLLESSFRTVVHDCDMAWLHETYTPSMIMVLRSAYRLGIFKKVSDFSKDYKIAHAGAPHWGNLFKSLKAFHEVDPLDSFHCPFSEGDITEVKVIIAAYDTVEAMREKTWVEVEQRLVK